MSCPMKNKPAAPEPSAQLPSGGCPVDHQGKIDRTNFMLAGGEKNMPAPRQRMPLDTKREVSNIPKGEFTPDHQTDADQSWVYPSPQMFYNAMKRKGFDPKEEEMSTVVAIHNAVNEQTWTEILKWEALHKSACAKPLLVKFEGRPKDYSPRARMLSMLGYSLPFDRHDWVVDRCGSQVRYVIDFYNGASGGSSPAVNMHLDVRPALDNFGGFYDRLSLAEVTASGVKTHKCAGWRLNRTLASDGFLLE